jgi:hypothetical protein
VPKRVSCDSKARKMVFAGSSNSKVKLVGDLNEQWEYLCCHQMEQGNQSEAAELLGIASSKQADSKEQAMI